MESTVITPEKRKKILKVLFFSLILDLISFTFILPLYPKLLEFYRNLESPSEGSNSALNHILRSLNAYKNAFAKPISDRYDIVLLGGAMGSMFSFLQTIASPIIGKLSDKYGRRTALLWSMAGNILSVALWTAATDFRTFLASRVVGGLSEGNIQLATAIAADISDEKSRGKTMALVGVCFSIAFTFGPALGAALANITTFAANPFATAAGFSLLLIVVETIYLYLALPETLPSQVSTTSNGKVTGKKPRKHTRTNSHLLLNATHFIFIFFFSGMEFSFPFLTYDLFGYSSAQTGKLLGFIGLIAASMQGGFTRRTHPLRAVQVGVLCCAVAFYLLGKVETPKSLYIAAAFLGVTTGTVSTGLGALSSFEATANERGGKLGNHRSWGQFGRALGPVAFCSLYWWAGRDVAYSIGGAGMAGVCALVFLGLKVPPGTEKSKAKTAVTD